jgi:nucleotide-binding universal stress UspA family protein
MKKIIVPLDFSPTSLKALEYAKYLSREFDYEILLLHAISSPTISTHAEIAIQAENLKKEEENSNRQLRELSEQLTTEGFKNSYRTKTGFLSDTLHELEQEIEVAYVVMGTTGASGILGRLIGNNASAVMQHIQSPLMLIPHESGAPNFKNLVFCTQFQTDETDVLKEVFAFAHHFSSHVDLLKINADWVLEIFSDNSEIERIKNTFPDEKFSIVIHKADSVIKGLDEYLEQHATNLIILAVRKKNILKRLLDGSTSRRIVLHSKIPMLIYHH